ncbi:MAG: C10 family peptidase [Bacteroidaceae bacterium]|nr:C10 family peptidase [Bacteroidaceae bacterium]
MKRILTNISAITFVALFVACTQDEEVLTNVEAAASRAEATIDNMKVKEPTTLDLLETYIKKVKFSGKDAPSYTLTPYEYEGDTVIYVANYEKGWELLSTDERTPIVLVSSEAGSYNEDEMPESVKTYIASIAEEVAASKKVENKDNKQHEDWKIIHKRNDEAKTRSGIEDYLGQGYWMLISSTPVSYSTDSIDHLTNTHWHQGYPFNEFVPYYGSYHSNAGCGPIAVGQLLKFYSDNVTGCQNWLIPMPPADSNQYPSLYNPSTNTYTYTNYGFGMVGLEPGGPGNSCPRAAYFVGYLGSRMNANYSNGKGTVRNDSIVSAVNDYISDPFIMENMNFVKVLSILGSGYPVLTTATTSSNGSDGHAFLIDKYVTDYTRYALVYAWVGTDIYGEPMNTYDEWGNVTSWVYSKTEYQTTGYSKISMNWCEDVLAYNDLRFSVYDTDWVVDTKHYKYNKKIYHNHY